MIAAPLVFPMGWVNSPPAFSIWAETIADVANERLRSPSYQTPPKHLDDMVETVKVPAETKPAPRLASKATVPLPLTRDPSLPTTGEPL